jgi:hypothetical protein
MSLFHLVHKSFNCEEMVIYIYIVSLKMNNFPGYIYSRFHNA